MFKQMSPERKTKIVCIHQNCTLVGSYCSLLYSPPPRSTVIKSIQVDISSGKSTEIASNLVQNTIEELSLKKKKLERAAANP